MAIKPSDINKGGHLTHLIVDELFAGIEDPKYKGAKQIFDAKTGKLIGTIRPGESLPQELNFNAEPEPATEPEPEIKNPNQGSLF